MCAAASPAPATAGGALALGHAFVAATSHRRATPGTINRTGDEFVKSPDDWEPLPGALEAISRLNHAGFHVVLVTNESGLGRGLFDMAAFNAVHCHLVKKLAAVGGRIDAFFYCPHAADEACACRKPLPGLFSQIAERYGVDLTGVPCIGNSLSDM